MQIRVFYPYFAALFILGRFSGIGCAIRLPPLTTPTTPASRRPAVLALVVAGLVRLSLTQLSQRANVVFLLDLSHSVAMAARQQALDFVRAISQHKPPQDGIGLVVFGVDAVVEQGVSQQFALSEVSSQVEGTATNIARAVQVDRQFPTEGARRLVLLSDGNENVGSAAEAALIARSLDAAFFAAVGTARPGT